MKFITTLLISVFAIIINTAVLAQDSTSLTAPISPSPTALTPDSSDLNGVLASEGAGNITTFTVYEGGKVLGTVVVDESTDQLAISAFGADGNEINESTFNTLSAFDSGSASFAAAASGCNKPCQIAAFIRRHGFRGVVCVGMFL
jgi:hypothetical protein